MVPEKFHSFTIKREPVTIFHSSGTQHSFSDVSTNNNIKNEFLPFACENGYRKSSNHFFEIVNWLLTE